MPQTGPGGPPLALRLSEGLGVTALARHYPGSEERSGGQGLRGKFPEKYTAPSKYLSTY